MGSDWQTAYLADLYDISSGLSKSAKYFGSGFPFVAFKDVMYNYFLPSELSQLVESTEQEQDKCSVKRGDVFLTRTSETMTELGMSSVAVKDYARATFNGFTKRLRPKFDTTLVPEFVAYYLRSPKFRSDMLAFSTMSTRASLNNEMISRLKISFPSVAEQRAIAIVLKTLDDKIELNRRMNETLESMARALFKSWFVDFDPVIDNALAAGNPIPEPLHARAEARRALGAQRKPLPAHIQKLFPDTFHFDEGMGWIPEEWCVQSIGKTIELSYGKSLPAGKRVAGNVPVYGSGGVSGWHNESLCEGPGLVVGRKGTVGTLYWVPENYFPIDTVFYVNNKSDAPLYWIYQSLQLIDIQSMGADSAVPGVNRNTIYARNFTLPSPSVWEAYWTNLEPMTRRMEALDLENQTLARLRDTLLPKLLSGELRIPDAEQLVAGSL